MAARSLIKLFKNGQAIVGKLLKKEVSKPSRGFGDGGCRSTLTTQAFKFSPRANTVPKLPAYLVPFTWKTLASELRKSAAESFVNGTKPSSGVRRFALLGFLTVGYKAGQGPLDQDEPSSNSKLEDLKNYQTSVLGALKQNIQKTARSLRNNQSVVKNLSDLDFGPLLDKGCNAAVYAARQTVENVDQSPQTDTYDLAVKVLFNYDVESNASAIEQNMKKEVLPIVEKPASQLLFWNKRKTTLPPHPGIVKMFSYFVDDMPELNKCMTEYPAALPPRLHRGGHGRNKTLFVVMKKYDCNLKEYLHNQDNIDVRNLPLFVQLLEGVFHLYEHDVVHRDLKSNNLLVEQTGHTPRLVISDFGSSWWDLSLAYTSTEVNKGGNTALMAPEIASATAGLLKYLDYGKADVWSCGAIAYEIFGCKNPFYRDINLDSRTYQEDDLPSFPDTLPPSVKAFVKALLSKNPKNRPTAYQAANWVELLLWAPQHWFEQEQLPSAKELFYWICEHATLVLFSRDEDTPMLDLLGIYLYRIGCSVTHVKHDVVTIRNLIKKNCS